MYGCCQDRVSESDTHLQCGMCTVKHCDIVTVHSTQYTLCLDCLLVDCMVQLPHSGPWLEGQFSHLASDWSAHIGTAPYWSGAWDWSLVLTMTLSDSGPGGGMLGLESDTTGFRKQSLWERYPLLIVVSTSWWPIAHNLSSWWWC